MLARYGGGSLLDHRGGHPLGFRSISCWWKDVSLLGFATEDLGHRSSHGVSKKVGSRVSTSFWNDSLLGNAPLRIYFFRLQVSSEREALVGNLEVRLLIVHLKVDKKAFSALRTIISIVQV